MAHNIERRNGKDAMFCVGDQQAAWHHLGQRIDRAATWDEAMQLALLDWDVVKEPLFDREGRELNTFGIFRETDREFFGNVGGVYTPIQNREAGRFLDTVLGASNGAHYESAGALGNGSKIWALARVPEADFEVVKGDEHYSYLLFCTTHDGSGAALCQQTTVRVVCNNTLTLALSHGNHGSAVRIRHTSDAERKMQLAQEMMQGVVQDSKELEAKLKTLATRKLTKEAQKAIFSALWPEPADKDTPAARAAWTRRTGIVEDVLKLKEINDKMQFAEIAGTAYNLLNAVTEWTDHLRGGSLNSKPEQQVQLVTRSESALFGPGSALKAKALDVILEQTAGAPSIVNQVLGVAHSL